MTPRTPIGLCGCLRLVVALSAGVLSCPAIASAQALHFQTLHQFAQANPTQPVDAPILASDGNFYGTLSGIGTVFNGLGAIFRMSPGGAITILHVFAPGPTDGGQPIGGLTQATDGNLYGVASTGGIDNNGVVYRLTLAGDFTIVHAFTSSPQNGFSPTSLMQSRDGKLYGTTAGGGANNAGTIFSLTVSGAFESVYDFSSPNASTPYGTLFQAADDHLYGTTFNGFDDFGTVYRLNLDLAGVSITVLHRFAGAVTDGDRPFAGVVQGADGNLYGTTIFGGASDQGIVYRISPDGATFTILHSFAGDSDGAQPQGRLLQGTDGNFYGTASAGGGSANAGVVFRMTPAGVVTILHAFDGVDGILPLSDLIQHADGNFYGTVPFGGAFGGGAVYSITPAGVLTAVGSFDGGQEAALPFSPLVLGTDGNFYGTAIAGSAANLGAVYKMTPAGDLTILHAFTGADTLGFGFFLTPVTENLVQATDGNFYGARADLLFKVTPGGAFTALHRLDPFSEGAFVRLMQATDGNFYGTTALGGPNDFGTMFKMAPDGTVTILHAFAGTDADGGSPLGGLVEGRDGGLYGTTFAGGASNVGTVFRASTAGDVTILHSFGVSPEGNSPYSGLTKAIDGSFYGVTSAGGAASAGTIYKIALTGEYAFLHALDPAKEGGGTFASLIQLPNGNFYGTSPVGNNGGSLFRMTPGGAVSVVHTFKGIDGLLPLSSLTATSNLHVYGTTLAGGQGFGGSGPGMGTMFHLIAQPAPSDYDGDAVSDLALYSAATGTWKILASSTLAPTTVSWGLSTDKPAPGDYDGDGMMDPTVFRPSTGMWHILKSSTNYSSSQSLSLGIRTDVPVPGDYDGDGITDPAVFRPSTGAWLILKSSTSFSTTMTLSLGLVTDLPVPGDYDGDGQTDIAVYRPSNGTWNILTSSTSYATPLTLMFGLSTDVPVPGDYDGDGKTDPATYAAATGTWSILHSSTGYMTSQVLVLGSPTSVAVPSDTDGDGTTDLVVFDRSTAEWRVLQSSDGFSTPSTIAFGSSDDTPLPNVVVYTPIRFSDSTRASDFDGDGKADPTVFRPTTGNWHVLTSGTDYTSSQTFSWGLGTDTPVAGDYDGDGLTDPAVYRASTGFWYVLMSSTGYSTSFGVSWGLSSDLPVPGDFDGDGKTDPAVFRPSTGFWYVLKSSTGYTSSIGVSWGMAGDVLVPADYDNDGKTDPAVYRPSTGGWHVLKSSTAYGSSLNRLWGLSTDIPVPGDYDGDRRIDFAVFRPSTGAWLVLTSTTEFSSYVSAIFGVSSDTPMPADYDGDGRFDFAVYRPATGEWRVLKSSTAYTSPTVTSWGLSTDTPIPRRP